jgi:cellulose biosynthesis protein BcsQ
MVIVITNRAGGVGKTTLSILASMSFVNRGHKVLLVDGDVSQADATYWSIKSDDFSPGVIYKTDYGYDVVWLTCSDDLHKINYKGYNVVVVDGRPSDYICGYFAVYSDLIVVPFFKRLQDVNKTRFFIRFLKKRGVDVKVNYFYNKYCREIAVKNCFAAPGWFKDYVTTRMLTWRGARE